MPEDKPNILKEKLKDEKIEYGPVFIKRILSEKESLRRVFLSIARHEPCIFHEIYEESFLTRPTVYSLLKKLQQLGIAGRLYSPFPNSPCSPSGSCFFFWKFMYRIPATNPPMA